MINLCTSRGFITFISSKRLDFITKDSAKYRSIAGCCIRIIVLGIFDIAYATSAMSMFNMLPREGYLIAVKENLDLLSDFRGVLSYNGMHKDSVQFYNVYVL
jgi:hypothetical protein